MQEVARVRNFKTISCGEDGDVKGQIALLECKAYTEGRGVFVREPLSKRVQWELEPCLGKGRAKIGTSSPWH